MSIRSNHILKISDVKEFTHSIASQNRAGVGFKYMKTLDAVVNLHDSTNRYFVRRNYVIVHEGDDLDTAIGVYNEIDH